MNPRIHACATMLAAALVSVSAYGEGREQIPVQAVDAKLRAKLPQDILKAGVITAVNNGSFPPYEMVGDNHSFSGASADLSQALSELLGIKIHHKSVGGLSSLLLGIKSGRFQFGMGPVGDFPDRQANIDFIDFVQEYVVFAVQAGNPKGIRTLADTCGTRIAVMSGGSAEKVIKEQAIACTKAGKPAIEVQSFSDQPTSILAVRSKRSDAFFSSQAPLTYFVKQTKGALELAGVGEKNGFHDLYQGAVVPKGTALGGVILEGLQKLFDNGTYAAIMKKWGLSGNMLKAPGVNLAGRQAK